MTFPSGLKRICDISFYMTFASIVGGWFGASYLIFTLPIFACVAFLSAFLVPYKRIKYISILPLFLLFVTTPLTIVNAVVLIPAILIMVVTLPKPGERVIEFNYGTVFYIFVTIFGIIALLATAMVTWVDATGLSGETWLFATIFLLSSMMFMRMARHDESVLKQTRFKMMNAASLFGVLSAIFGAVLLGTDAFLTSALRVIAFLWSYLIAPIINVIIWLFLVILTFIFNMLGLNFEPGEVEMGQMPMMQNEIDEYYIEGGQVPRLVIAIIIVIAIIAFVVLLKFLFKLLNKRTDSIFVGEDGVEEERFSLDGHEQKKRRMGRRHENQIRAVYRRFLANVKKKGIHVPQHLTSYDVEGLVATKYESEKSSYLRAEYIGVRYGDASYTEEDVRRIKGLYREIKVEMEKF